MCVALLLVNLCVCFAYAKVTVDRVPAYRIKAAYIYKFIQFVSWPQKATSGHKKFNICTLGQGPLVDELYTLDRSRQKDYLIHVYRVSALSETANCHILYIASEEEYRFKKIMRFLRNKPVLTISDMPGFASRGGMIGFVNVDRRVRIQLNRDAVSRVNIRFNAKLLEVASHIFDSDTERAIQ